MTQQIIRYQQGPMMLPADTTEDKLIELWLRAHSSANTQKTYKSAISRYQEFVNKPLASVNLEEALNFRDSLAEMKDNSSRIIINAVKSFHSFALEMGLFPVNVWKLIKPASAKSAVHRRLLPEAVVVNMIMQEPDLRNECALRLLYSAGLRVSEMCNLQWKDVTVLSSGVGTIHIEKGKGDKSRSIPLNDSSWEKLQELRQAFPESDYVIASRQKASSVKGRKEKGEKIDESSIFKIVRIAAKRVSIPNWEQVSPHWLRHCHGSHAINRNVPVTVVRDTLGHSNIAITDIYAHTSSEESSSRKLPL